MRGTVKFFLLLACATAPGFAQKFSNPDTLGPDIPTPMLVIEKMLDAAQLKPTETLYDLGCGEGRVIIMAAQKYKAHAVGIELSRDIYEQTSGRIKSMGLDSMVTIVHGNALHYDLSPADVVTLYFLTSSNDRLKPVLEKYLKPTARVVSHDYEIRGWKPSRKESVPVDGRAHMIYVYSMATRGQ
jgi:ubiquinone/menaquinone biosynthesis C-methylase UbiE